MQLLDSCKQAVWSGAGTLAVLASCLTSLVMLPAQAKATPKHQRYRSIRARNELFSLGSQQTHKQEWGKELAA